MRAPKNVRLNAEREMILLFRTVKNAERVLLSLSLSRIASYFLATLFRIYFLI